MDIDKTQNNWDELEHALEERMQSLAGDLDLSCPPSVVARVCDATHHELNEQWLTDQQAPEPDTQALDQIRSAVRDELRRLSRASRHVRRPAVRGAWSAIGVAAVLAMIAIGVARYTSLQNVVPAGDAVPPSEAIARTIQHDPVDLFVQAADRIWVDTPLLADLRTDLDDFEQSLTQWQSADDDFEEVLDDIDSRLDGLFDKSEIFDELGSFQMIEKGAMT